MDIPVTTWFIISYTDNLNASEQIQFFKCLTSDYKTTLPARNDCILFYTIYRCLRVIKHTVLHDGVT